MDLTLYPTGQPETSAMDWWIVSFFITDWFT